MPKNTPPTVEEMKMARNVLLRLPTAIDVPPRTYDDIPKRLAKAFEQKDERAAVILQLDTQINLRTVADLAAKAEQAHKNARERLLGFSSAKPEVTP